MKVFDVAQLKQANIIHAIRIQEPANIQNTSKDSVASWYAVPKRKGSTILIKFSKLPHSLSNIKQASIPHAAYRGRHATNK
jgi:hypothetical protein